MTADRQDGFTLLEVIVAFIVVTLTLTAVMQIFSGGLRNSETSRDYMTALSRAENTLERMGTEWVLREGTREGRFDDGMTWQRTVKQVGRENDLWLYEAEVRIRFADGAREVALKTLKLSAR